MNDNEESTCVTSDRMWNASSAPVASSASAEPSHTAPDRTKPGRPRITADDLPYLTQRIGVCVELDESGYANDSAALRVAVAADGNLKVLAILTPSTMSQAKLLALNILGRCDQYNTALAKLQSLRARFAVIVARATGGEHPAVRQGHQVMLQLDDRIAARGQRLMEGGVIHISTLADEVLFWEHYLDHFTRIADNAEK